jgi:hypothetical protein
MKPSRLIDQGDRTTVVSLTQGFVAIIGPANADRRRRRHERRRAYDVMETTEEP